MKISNDTVLDLEPQFSTLTMHSPSIGFYSLVTDFFKGLIPNLSQFLSLPTPPIDLCVATRAEIYG